VKKEVVYKDNTSNDLVNKDKSQASVPKPKAKK